MREKYVTAPSLVWFVPVEVPGVTGGGRCAHEVRRDPCKLQDNGRTPHESRLKGDSFKVMKQEYSNAAQ